MIIQDSLEVPKEGVEIQNVSLWPGIVSDNPILLAVKVNI